jgi:hypothetical protein
MYLLYGLQWSTAGRCARRLRLPYGAHELKGASIPLEGSIVPIVSDMVMEGADHHRLIPGVEPALLATTGAWAVFGAARMWHQTPGRIPAEEMAAKIEAMVKPIFLNSFG